MDLTEIKGEHFERPVFMLMMMAWAIVADVDINSEVIRFMGNARIQLYAILKIVQDPTYRAKFAFNGQKITNAKQKIDFDDQPIPEDPTDI